MNYIIIIISFLYSLYFFPIYSYTEEGFEILLNAYYDRDYYRLQKKNPYEIVVSCQNIDFSGMDLSGMDLSYAVCLNCNFSGCMLKGTKFFRANLKGSIFDDAQMEEADFSEANW